MVAVEPNLRGPLQRAQKLEESARSRDNNNGNPASSAAVQDILAHPSSQNSQIILNKTRVLGWSLRIGITQEFRPIMTCYTTALNSTKDAANQDTTELGALFNQIGALLQKCKNIARAIKVVRPSRCLLYPEFDLAPPPRAVADAMVNLYFQFFESAYRILHVPTFWSEYRRYWDNPESATTSLRLQILLVIGIGSSLSEQGHADTAAAGFRNSVHRWIYAAQAWVGGPMEKDRLTISGLQIHCLTVLARQIFSVGGDLVWMSIGSLIHCAMQMGLHRDPKHLPSMSVVQAELRRRLWATILEMVVQSSLDTAMPPRISFEEFDTAAPANNNDDELDDATTTPPPPHPKNIYTAASMQLLLLESLPTRIRVLHLLNGLRSSLSYTDVLALSAEITEACRTGTRFVLTSTQQSGGGAAPFHRRMLEYLVRRFLIPLHSPFATKARENPLFYYSHKASLDAAMAMISSSSLVPNADNDKEDAFSRLIFAGGGMFREVFRYASTVVAAELVAQVEERRQDGGGATDDHASRHIAFLKQTVGELLAVSAERIRRGETNVKSHMFLAMVLAQVEATEAGCEMERAVTRSARESLEFCHGLLREQLGGDAEMGVPDAGGGLTPLTVGFDEEAQGFGWELDLDLFWPDGGFE